uniref:E2F transcription factor CC-MB domain-containing protein n=1 Tax=Pundamilia nyererei TaxID=303518 RepID=A0A3B4FWL8_9CICH
MLVHRGGQLNEDYQPVLKALGEEERKLDELIQSCTDLLFLLSSLTLWLTYAYLTYKDIYRIPALKDQTVIVIKAPTETQLVVPHPDEVHVSRTRCKIISNFCSLVELLLFLSRVSNSRPQGPVSCKF